ncbi:hypothetical protein AB0F46_35265 [Streptomyces sp. NPDC026665]|uniref:hypothetical protein n=1 Tax=Streptomyces sp. NPDC026665 TaxID=3154798 RepID=UPI0033FA64B9
MSLPPPRDEHHVFEDKLLDELMGPRMLPPEVYHHAVTVWQCPPSPLPDDAQQVWIRPDGTDDWQHVGYTAGPVFGMDHGAPDPSASAVLAVPVVQYGNTTSFTVEAPLTGTMRALFDALTTCHRAHLDRRLLRIAEDLGQWEPHVRRDFSAVQQVLEAAGIGDGYGRLTIPQPVRPPIEPPAPRP